MLGTVTTETVPEEAKPALCVRAYNVPSFKDRAGPESGRNCTEPAGRIEMMQT